MTMHGHGDCPGCIQPLVGHDADCEVMSEKVVPRYEQPGTRRRSGPEEQQASIARNECQLCGSKHDSQITLRIHYEHMHGKLAAALQAHAGAPQIPPEPQDTGKSAAARIRERIAEKRSLYEHYHQHTKRMWEEHDAHGGWDSFINGSEVSNRIDELEWCLAVIEGREP